MKPINNILVPTDFSKGATSALKYAIKLAQAAEAQLFILHNRPSPKLVPADTYALTNDSFGTHSTVTYQEEQEAALALHLSGQSVAYELIFADDRLEQAARRTIDRQAIDLVVVGAAGYEAGHLEFCPDCPLIVVPENTTFTKGGRIVVATDYLRIPHADTFQILVTLANVLHTRLDVLHITCEDPELTPRRLITADMIDRLLRHTYHSYLHLESNRICDGLEAYQGRYGKEATMIAIMTHHHRRGEYWTGKYLSGNAIKDQPIFIY